MQERCNDYERRAKILRAFCEEQTGFFEDTKSLGETLDEAKETIAQLREFVVTTKPAQAGELMDLETLFAEIQTELTVNGRKPFVPAEGLAPEQLNTAWDTLTAQQKAYATATRDNRFKFIHKSESSIPEEKLAEIEASFRHFDSNKSNTLDINEFKAALSAMSISHKDDGELKKVFAAAHGGSGDGTITLEQYIEFLRSKYEDRDSPDQLLESFKAVADGSGTITDAQLNTRPLTDADIEFLRANLKKNEDGTYDYTEFVTRNFGEE